MLPVAGIPNQPKKRSRSQSATDSPRSQSPTRPTPPANPQPTPSQPMGIPNPPAAGIRRNESVGSTLATSYDKAVAELAEIMDRRLYLNRTSIPERPKTPPLLDKDDKDNPQPEN